MGSLGLAIWLLLKQITYNEIPIFSKEDANFRLFETCLSSEIIGLIFKCAGHP